MLVRDTERPHRGGVVMTAAQRTSDDIVTFMATHARGIISLALPARRLERLGIAPMGEVMDLEHERYTCSIEARVGVSTGISAADRARTVAVAIDPHAGPEALVTPGHVFPSEGDERGLLGRMGWSEAGLDLARIAGLSPAACYCQVLDDEGELAGPEGLDAFAQAHGLVSVTLGDIIAHRRAHESFVTLLSQSTLPTAHGDFVVRVFRDDLDGTQHMALTRGEVRTSEPVLARIHSECLTGDVFGSARCDCGDQLNHALARVASEGRGVVVYLRQEGRGIGLVNKLRAYALQDQGRDTVEANLDLGLPAEARDFTIGGQILLALGVQRVRLMTNNPRKVAGVTSVGLEVTERVSIEMEPTTASQRYLRTKKAKLGHILSKV